MLRTEAGAARRETGGGRRLLPPPSSPLRNRIPFTLANLTSSAPVAGAGWPWGGVVLARFRRVACVTDAKRTIRTEPDVPSPVSAPAPAGGVRGRDAARGDGCGGAWRKLWGTGALRRRGFPSRPVPDPVGKVETHAFGVDPADNSVYVGDEPTTGEYRIQKLSATGTFLASVSFKPANPIGLEGIARP